VNTAPLTDTPHARRRVALLAEASRKRAAAEGRWLATRTPAALRYLRTAADRELRLFLAGTDERDAAWSALAAVRKAADATDRALAADATARWARLAGLGVRDAAARLRLVAFGD